MSDPCLVAARAVEAVQARQQLGVQTQRLAQRGDDRGDDAVAGPHEGLQLVEAGLDDVRVRRRRLRVADPQHLVLGHVVELAAVRVALVVHDHRPRPLVPVVVARRAHVVLHLLVQGQGEDLLRQVEHEARVDVVVRQVEKAISRRGLVYEVGLGLRAGFQLVEVYGRDGRDGDVVWEGRGGGRGGLV